MGLPAEFSAKTPRQQQQNCSRQQQKSHYEHGFPSVTDTNRSV